MGQRNLRFAVVMGLHTLISAGTYLLGKAAADAIPTLALGLLRFLIAGAGFLLLAKFRGLELWSVAKADWRAYFWAGFLGVALNQVAFLGGLALTLPSHAALLYALTPTMVLLLAWVRGQERPGPRKLGGLALAFSGVAVLLELSRALAPLSFERTVHFIGVSLEENAHDDDHDSGTRGSRALADFARSNGWDLTAVLVLESVGFAGDDVLQTVPPGVPIAVPEVGNFIAVVGNERSRELSDAVVRAVEAHRIKLPHVVLTVPGNGEMLPDSRRSDHAPFWDEGFRAVMLTDTTNFRNPNYHRSTDTLATLNLGFAARVCHATAGALLELAGVIDPAN